MAEVTQGPDTDGAAAEGTRQGNAVPWLRGQRPGGHTRGPPLTCRKSLSKSGQSRSSPYSPWAKQRHNRPIPSRKGEEGGVEKPPRGSVAPAASAAQDGAETPQDGARGFPAPRCCEAGTPRGSSAPSFLRPFSHRPRPFPHTPRPLSHTLHPFPHTHRPFPHLPRPLSPHSPPPLSSTVPSSPAPPPRRPPRCQDGGAAAAAGGGLGFGLDAVGGGGGGRGGLGGRRELPGRPRVTGERRGRGIPGTGDPGEGSWALPAGGM